jgi:large subunit ribosomal protein L5
MSQNKNTKTEDKVQDPKTNYISMVAKEMKSRYPTINPMEIPSLKKIVINMGVGEAVKDKHAIDNHLEELTMIAGQKPVITKSKKAISNFKLREDQPIGLMVTLRGKRMYDFFYRFCNINAPRINDFRGYSRKQFDGQGNYNFGITDQTIFLEVNQDKVKRTQGMDIAVVTSAKNDESAQELLSILRFPFEAEKNQEKSNA